MLLSVSFLLIEDHIFFSSVFRPHEFHFSCKMTAHSAARLTHYLVAQREENFFLLFEGVSGKSMRRLVHPSNANRLQTHLPALLCGSWHFFLSGCLIFMVAAMFDLGLRLFLCSSVLQHIEQCWSLLAAVV